MRQMIGIDYIVLLLIKPVGDNDFIRIFLRINRMLLKTDMQFVVNTNNVKSPFEK